MFMEFLLALYFEGKATARTVCALSWWATKAGAKGPMSAYAYRPDSQSGQFAAHIDRAHAIDMEVMKSSMLKIAIPRYEKHRGGRAEVLVPVVAPHEAIASELAQDPSIMDRLRRSLATEQWPAAYTEHEVVKAADDAVLPCALYLDGTPLSERDGVTGFWIYNLITMRRHLCAVVRKSELCRCGCKGWCTWWSVWNMLSWSFMCLQQGRYPDRDCLNRPWHDDLDRARKAGSRLHCQAILYMVKGDWMEFTSTVGYANWRTKGSPCFLCKAEADTMFSFQGLGVRCHPAGWDRVTRDDVEAACSRCEKVVALSQDQHLKLRTTLTYDLRKKSTASRGRIANWDYPDLGLISSDRLEPSRHVPNVGEIENATVFPLVTTWWDRSRETRVRHRNPIWNVPGVTPRTFRVDALHSLYLGPCRDWCGGVVWLFIHNRVFARADADEESAKTATVLHIHHLLTVWYRAERKRMPGKSLTTINYLAATMVGSAKSPKMSTKAAETCHCMPFFVELLEMHRARLGPKMKPFLLCGQGLVHISDIMKEGARCLKVAELQRFHDAMSSVARMWQVTGLRFKPKLHLLAEMVYESSWSGNPSYAWTFEDEGLNKILAHIGFAAHRKVWEYRVFAHWSEFEAMRISKNRVL